MFSSVSFLIVSSLYFDTGWYKYVIVNKYVVKKTKRPYNRKIRFLQLVLKFQRSSTAGSVYLEKVVYAMDRKCQKTDGVFFLFVRTLQRGSWLY